MLILTDHWSGIMEAPSYIKKTIGACCRIKEEGRRKSKEEYLRKTIARYFERGILTYLNKIIQRRRRFFPKNVLRISR